VRYDDSPDGGAGLAERGGERLSLGVAARLSRYLQVLTQAKKMGKDTISSQELADYTHVNSTQIRRDLSGFGKFGKRGVGYNVDSLVSQIRKILRTTGRHNIALFGAGHLGKVVEEEDIVVGVLAVPTEAAQGVADDLVRAGVKIIFNYSEALLQVPPDVTVHTSSPAVDLLYALYFYLT
jgi:redox-sensing transcriptional repressor